MVWLAKTQDLWGTFIVLYPFGLAHEPFSRKYLTTRFSLDMISGRVLLACIPNMLSGDRVGDPRMCCRPAQNRPSKAVLANSSYRLVN